MSFFIEKRLVHFRGLEKLVSSIKQSAIEVQPADAKAPKQSPKKYTPEKKAAEKAQQKADFINVAAELEKAMNPKIDWKNVTPQDKTIFDSIIKDYIFKMPPLSRANEAIIENYKTVAVKNYNEYLANQGSPWRLTAGVIGDPTLYIYHSEREVDPSLRQLDSSEQKKIQNIVYRFRNNTQMKPKERVAHLNKQLEKQGITSVYFVEGLKDAGKQLARERLVKRPENKDITT